MSVNIGSTDWLTIAPVLVLEDEETILAVARVIVDTNGALTGKRLDAAGVNDYAQRTNRQQRVEKVSTVIWSVFGVQFGSSPQERHQDISDAFDQVSLLAEYLSKDHYFADGNKRTTVLAVLGLLSVNGIRIVGDDSLDSDKNFIYRWIQGIVTHASSRSEFAKSLRTHAQLVDE